MKPKNYDSAVQIVDYNDDFKIIYRVFFFLTGTPLKSMEPWLGVSTLK